MKAKFIATANHRVVIQFCPVVSGDEMVEIEYSAPVSGGYVRNSDNKQVCKKLSTRGDTLQWAGDKSLIDLIRREYKAMRRAEKAPCL